MLPTIAKLIDESLGAAQEQYATLSQARAKPYVLDDSTLARTQRVFGEDLEWIEVYERELERWEALPLTAGQARRSSGSPGSWPRGARSCS